MINKPIIGISADYSTKDTYSKYPWYALRENYASSLANLGATPLILPYDLASLNHYESILDGILITGGDFDISPSYYGGTNHPSIKLIENRTSFELELFKTFYNSNKPILGICGGHQLINVALGGSLIQDIPDQYPNALNHSQIEPPHTTSHTVDILEGSLLYNICQSKQIKVNSRHHQAVLSTGEGVTISGYASDEIIESIEDQKHHFCLGIQWHPEFICTEHDRKILTSFIHSCQKKN